MSKKDFKKSNQLLEHSRLAQECEKLDVHLEQAMAEGFEEVTLSQLCEQFQTERKKNC
jgi:hypothetical protein